MHLLKKPERIGSKVLICLSKDALTSVYVKKQAPPACSVSLRSFQELQMLLPVYHIWILLHTGLLSFTVVVFPLQITVAIVWKRLNSTSTMLPIIWHLSLDEPELLFSNSRPADQGLFCMLFKLCQSMFDPGEIKGGMTV
jgi:hypothetical protein